MSIVEISNKTLYRIEQNDPKLTSLSIANRGHSTGNTSDTFWLHDSADVSRLGNAIANNTHLERIIFQNCSEWKLDTRFLFEGLQRNTTIKKLWLHGGIGIGILNEFVTNCSSITDIAIQTCDLRDGVASALAQAVTKCPNVDKIYMTNCKFDDASLTEFASWIKGLSCLQELQMWNYSSINSIDIEGARAIGSLPLVNLKLYKVRFNNESSIQTIVNGLRGNTKLEHLTLFGSSIRNIGCEAIANLLQGPSCNLTKLDLINCEMNDECIQIIVNSLMGNTKLEHLDLSTNNIGWNGCRSIETLLQNPNSNISRINLRNCNMDSNDTVSLARSLEGNKKLTCLDLAYNSRITKGGWDYFSTILSNYSNHTLLSLGDGIRNMPTTLRTLLKLNLAVDMEPLFKLDTDDDERNLKALPSVIDWFDRRVRKSIIDLFVRESNQNEEVDSSIDARKKKEEVLNSINARKLSAIFQFARAMPLQFIPSPSDITLLHREARDELEVKKEELESQITTMIKAKEELEDKIKVKDKIIKDRLEVSGSSIDSLTKKRKHGE